MFVFRIQKQCIFVRSKKSGPSLLRNRQHGIENDALEKRPLLSWFVLQLFREAPSKIAGAYRNYYKTGFLLIFSAFKICFQELGGVFLLLNTLQDVLHFWYVIVFLLLQKRNIFSLQKLKLGRIRKNSVKSKQLELKTIVFNEFFVIFHLMIFISSNQRGIKLSST